MERVIITSADATARRESRDAVVAELAARYPSLTIRSIQALRNFVDVDEYRRTVYARPEHLPALAISTPVSAHVDVDFELRGCPVDRRQLLEVITAFLADRRPDVPNRNVCFECKRRGTVCVTWSASCTPSTPPPSTRS